ncbi:MAG: family 10 glycosylhydrolase [Planctomycetota bacterium]|nr:family 10 glycosylhydrolase [Planctomycetota bacterium]
MPEKPSSQTIFQAALVGLIGMCGLLLAASAPCPAADAKNSAAKNSAVLKELRKTRKIAAEKQRRIVFNNDGNEPVYYCKEATAEELLKCRTTGLLGSHVDSIFYCTWSSGFGYFTHATKLGYVFDTTDVAGDPKGKGFSTNKTAEFIKRGSDPLEIMVDFSKKNGLEVFWSFRMNDTHDSWNGWYSDTLFPPIKREHPEWLVSNKKKRSKHGGWSAMDFARPQVRDLAVGYIKEVCENYDVDGIEMDFFRHLVYFKAVAQDKDTPQAERDMMTDMVRRVRDMTEQIGLKRGRPILVSVRVPDSVEAAAVMGFDIERWMKEGLVDILAVSGYFRLNDWETTVALGKKYDVPVFAGLSESRVRDDPGRVRNSIEAYRGRAMNAWDAGVDSVYLFNLFNPKLPQWRELGEPDKLALLDKVYVANIRGTTAARRWIPRADRFINRKTTICPENPMKLPPGKPAVGWIRVGEDIAGNQSDGRKAQVTLRLRMPGTTDPEDYTVKLGDKVLTGGKKTGPRTAAGKPLKAAKGKKQPAREWLEFQVEPQHVRRGFNRIEITLNKNAKGKPQVWKDIQLSVRY